MGAEELAMESSSSPSSRRTGFSAELPATGRRLLVAMKLNLSCREMLTWTIAKLAQPGDHILALHVSPRSPPWRGQGAGSSIEEQVEEEESHTEKLANTLRGVLSVYESLCNLKQIKLQLEIVSGYKIKNVLVEVASSYEACKLILGTNKSFSVGRTKALGRYCLKRLPCTCTVVILEQGEIIFDKKGRLGADMTRLDMIKVFRRSMRFGRTKSIAKQTEEPDSNTNPKKPTHTRQRSLSDLPSFTLTTTDTHAPAPAHFGSCSSIIHEDFSNVHSPVSVLPSDRRNSNSSTSSFEALRLSFSKRRAQQQQQQQGALKTKVYNAAEVERSDMFLLPEQETKERSSPAHVAREEDDVVVPGWPLLKNTIGFEKEKENEKKAKGDGKNGPSDRDLSVVRWALHLPDKRGHHDPAPSPKGLPREAAEAEVNQSRVRDSRLSLAQEVDRLLAHPRDVHSENRRCAAFAYEDLDAATAGFSQGNVVGRGGGSEVFRGTLRDGRVVAVKRLLNQSIPQAEEELLIDIEINTTLQSHPHVVALLGYCVEPPSHMFLVYDYLPEGNLEDHLHAPGKEAAILPWEVRHKVAVGIARALEYLHKDCARPVVHRDVKTSNILLTANFESQLSDFGLAKWAPTKASHLLCNDVVGTFGYLAPEYFMFGRVNDKTDVYAFGVVLLELITGRKPIDTTRPKGEENLVNWARPLLVARALNKLVDPLLGGAYDEAQMNTMVLAAFLSIQQSVQRRPQMTQILQVLSSSTHDGGEAFSTCMVATSAAAAMSTSDPEEVDANNYNCGCDETDAIRSHLALAMMGVDDDAASQCSAVDLVPHSNKFLEEYLEERYSRSTSFED